MRPTKPRDIVISRGIDLELQVGLYFLDPEDNKTKALALQVGDTFRFVVFDGRKNYLTLVPEIVQRGEVAYADINANWRYIPDRGVYDYRLTMDRVGGKHLLSYGKATVE